MYSFFILLLREYTPFRLYFLKKRQFFKAKVVYLRFIHCWEPAAIGFVFKLGMPFRFRGFLPHSCIEAFSAGMPWRPLITFIPKPTPQKAALFYRLLDI